MKINFNTFEVELFSFGDFRLDGGAMFGNVPKNLWAKRLPSDNENCIPLTTRCMLISMDNRKILVDVGMGDKWNDKAKTIYEIKNVDHNKLPFKAEEITDVVLTHLHFDHGGGITRFTGDKIVPTYPNATIHIQRANYENAKQPSLRERASYLSENVEPLDMRKLNLLAGPGEILPHISGQLANGHTRGLQWIKVSDSKQTIAFPSDLIPTSHHAPLPYIMGYDICAETVLSEKQQFLEAACNENWLIVFEHDRHNQAGRIRRDEKGGYYTDDLVAA